MHRGGKKKSSFNITHGRGQCLYSHALLSGGQVSSFLCHQEVVRLIDACVVLVEDFHMTLGAGGSNIKPVCWACETW